MEVYSVTVSVIALIKKLILAFNFCFSSDELSDQEIEVSLVQFGWVKQYLFSNDMVQWNLQKQSPLNNSHLPIIASYQYLQSAVLLYII